MFKIVSSSSHHVGCKVIVIMNVTQYSKAEDYKLGWGFIYSTVL